MHSKSYRDLEIYVESKRLAIEIHKMSLLLPRFEQYEEASQIRRASKAVTALIVEGYARKRYLSDFVKYLTYSHAECDETLVHWDFLFETGSFQNKEAFESLRDQYIELSKKIYRFIKWVERNFKP
jgi:four helix bundle protein